jgi:hypothetical protein
MNAVAQKPHTIMKRPRENATGPVNESASCFRALSHGKFADVFASAVPVKAPKQKTAMKTASTTRFKCFLFKLYLL